MRSRVKIPLLLLIILAALSAALPYRKMATEQLPRVTEVAPSTDLTLRVVVPLNISTRPVTSQPALPLPSASTTIASGPTRIPAIRADPKLDSVAPPPNLALNYRPLLGFLSKPAEPNANGHRLTPVPWGVRSP